MFQFFQDNTESEIGDSIHQALDIVTELIKSGDREYTNLIEAIATRDVLKSVVYTHQFLGSDYLDVQQLFRDFEGYRKTEEKVSKLPSSLEELNTLIRKCPIDSLAEVFSKRGDLLQSSKRYKEAIKEYLQCLKFTNNANNDYLIYNKIAQVCVCY